MLDFKVRVGIYNITKRIKYIYFFVAIYNTDEKKV